MIPGDPRSLSQTGPLNERSRFGKRTCLVPQPINPRVSVLILNMTSQKRIGNFLGTDSDYIAYLESIIHQAIPMHALPSPPCSSDKAGPSSIGFISYEPELYNDNLRPRPAKRQRTQPRWKHEMDGMLHDLKISDWSSEREKVGLASSAEILTAFDILIATKPSMGLAVCTTVACYDTSNAVLQLLETFGSATAALKVGKTFAKQIYLFHELIFVSTCSVALQHGANQDEVDEIMRRHISSTDGKNLDRLRSGALWANRMMNKLAADGFKHMAYEFFVIRKL